MATPKDHIPEEQQVATDLATTLVDFSQMATHGASIVNVFSVLSNQCVQLLPVSAAGILLVDNDNSLHVIGSSSHAVTLLDLFQVQNNEGPCRECCATHELVASENLTTDGRWPNFSELATKENFVAVYALPLQAQDVVVGALNLFSEAATIQRSTCNSTLACRCRNIGFSSSRHATRSITHCPQTTTSSRRSQCY